MNENKDFDKKSGEIKQLAALPPEQLVQHLSNTHQNLGKIAPNIAPHLHATAIRAIQFLNSKISGSGNELLQDQPPMTSDSHKRAWLDLHKTVSDPTSIFNHVKNFTLTRHHVEALQSVYPDLHQEIVQKMQEQLGALKSKAKVVPYENRVSISKLMGQPLDSSMVPTSALAIISSAAQNMQPAQQGRGKATKKASGPELTQLNKVNALDETPLQARQAQKRS